MTDFAALQPIKAPINKPPPKAVRIAGTALSRTQCSPFHGFGGGFPFLRRLEKLPRVARG
jgi:sporulation-control protein spo0M